MSDLKAVARVSSGGGSRPKLRRRASLVSALAVLGSLALVASATAKTIALPGTCGQTISKSGIYALTSDIGPCSSTAITISANGVKLNLNGHTVAGNPLTFDSSGNVTGGYGEGPGIQAIGTSGDVIQNGTVRDFDAGVLLTQSNTRLATGNTVTSLNVVNNVGLQPPTDFSDGIALIGTSANYITNNTLTGNGSRAIGLIDTNRNNTISGNTVTNNQSVGIALTSFGNGNVITGNTIRGNGSNGVGLSFDDANNVIQNNTIDSNRGNGFRASFNSNGNVVQNNAITNNGQNGIAFSSGNDTATGNTVTGNGTRGQAGNADGIFLSGGSSPSNPLGSDVVSGNVITNNAGNGIRITCTVDETTGACDNVAQSDQILNNTVNGNGGTAAGTQLLAGNGFLIGVYDLLDGNNSVNDAATSPAGTAPDCDSNTWSGNYSGTQTGFPACTEG